MRLTRRLGEPALACTLLVVAGCSGADVNAPLSDARRELAILQLESSVPLASAYSERARGAAVAWFPPIDDVYTRLFVPAEVIEAPDTVRAGDVVAVVVNSIAENGCWQADGGTLTQRGDTAVVTAFDRHSGAVACTQIWTDRLRHAFTTAFPHPGVGVVRAYGRRVLVGKPGIVIPIVAQRAVVVLP
ncbi:MAG: hypothetical protein IT360_24345 [Gemmatimonadaceae bacterium]|nr:hypothetical protein [Gemmatimonadaceae bacterium]